MKKLMKLKIKKITLQNLDETSLQGIAGAISYNCSGNTCNAGTICTAVHGVCCQH